VLVAGVVVEVGAVGNRSGRGGSVSASVSVSVEGSGGG
jgi:hypothetical protein